MRPPKPLPITATVVPPGSDLWTTSDVRRSHPLPGNPAIADLGRALRADGPSWGVPRSACHVQPLDWGAYPATCRVCHSVVRGGDLANGLCDLCYRYLGFI